MIKSREQVKGNMRRIGLSKEDAADRCRWREGVRRVAEVVRYKRAISSHWGSIDDDDDADKTKLNLSPINRISWNSDMLFHYFE